jgi:predicted HTH domain antitoxin
MAMPRSYLVEVELPEEAFRHHPWSPGEVAADLRLLWLVDLVRQRRLGYARAAALAGMPQAMFVRVLGAHRVPCFDLDDDEIDGEVAAGRTLGRAPPA